MKLYHGSNCRIVTVELSYSRRYMDFGVGFYLTPDFQRAVTMANRATELKGGGSPEVNPFIFNPKTCTGDIKILEFKSNNWEWAKFVMLNRDRSLGTQYKHEYDIVIGPVADSKVDPEIKDYKEEFGEKYLEPKNLKILDQRLRYSGTKYMQYCFCTKRALKYLIRD